VLGLADGRDPGEVMVETNVLGLDLGNELVHRHQRVCNRQELLPVGSLDVKPPSFHGSNLLLGLCGCVIPC